MYKHKIPVDAKAELERYVWGTFVEGKATVALGGTGVVVSGREACRKRFGTDSQYLQHLADDFLPQIIERVLFAADACQGTYLPSSRGSSMEGFSFSELKDGHYIGVLRRG
jgi:hypothetical protein